MDCQKLETSDSWVWKSHLVWVRESGEALGHGLSFKSPSLLKFFLKVLAVARNSLEIKCQLNYLLCDPDLIISKRVLKAPTSQLLCKLMPGIKCFKSISYHYHYNPQNIP